jgi:hypothetical protein
MSSSLDAEGSSHYRDDLDYIPAINSSVLWLINVVNKVLAEKKMSPEIFRELTLAKVWQTNDFSRFSFGSPDLEMKLWTVISIIPQPKVYVPQFDALDLTAYSSTFSNAVLAVGDQDFQNAPLLDYNPITAAPLARPDSIYRPDLVHLEGENSAYRLTHEEWSVNKNNPFRPGNIIDKCNGKYAYLDPTDYNTMKGGYVTDEGWELEIRPTLNRQLVTMVFVRTPEEVTLVTDTIKFPVTFFEMIVAKALQFISYKQGDGTNLYSVTARDISTLLTSIG